MLYIKLCVFTILSLGIFSLKVSFERAYIVSFNPKYVEFAFANVTRYGRRSEYYGNVQFATTYVAHNNVTVNIYFYEFRRNTYKRSFIELRYKLCDFLEHDPYIGKVATAAGVACPIEARKYSLTNLTINLEDFPNVFPFEKGRINFCFNASASGESIGEGVLFLSFKNELGTKKHG